MRRWLLHGTLALLLVGCAAGPEPVPGPAEAPSVSPAPPAQAGPPPVAPPPSPFERARELHLAGVAGDTRQAIAALEALEAVAARRPGDPLREGYLGSARLLAASRATAFWVKGQLLQQGLKLLDGAVERAPQELELRFIRGASTRPLPAPFGRASQSAADLEYVAARAVAAVRAGRLAPRIGAAALLLHGQAVARAQGRSAAVPLWQDVIAVGPGTAPAREAARRLAAP